jgi:accessory gene regulator protein AgrB
VFIIYLLGKDLYQANETANGSQMGVSTIIVIIVQVIKRKPKNTEGSNRINKKTIKKRPSKGLLSLLVLFLVSLVTVGSMGIGMTNLLYI